MSDLADRLERALNDGSDFQVWETAAEAITALRADARDAARYRWLKGRSGLWWDEVGYDANLVGQLDAVIDASMEDK